MLNENRVVYINGNVLSLNHHDLLDAIGPAQTLFFKVGKLGDPNSSSDINQAWNYINLNALALWRMLPSLTSSNLSSIIVDSSITAIADFSFREMLYENSHVVSQTNFYGLSKAILEDICLFIQNTTELNCRIIRYPRVYSPHHAGFLSVFSRMIAKSEPLLVHGDLRKYLTLFILMMLSLPHFNA